MIDNIVILSDHTYMPVTAKNSKGGRRYLTQKDVLVEVCPLSYRDSRARKDGKGNIHVWMVKDNGELDKSRTVLIPVDYALKPVVIEPGKKGRRSHPDKTWRGWAYSNTELPEGILREARDQGCYLLAATNYVTVGWGGRKLFVVYRSGILAFDELPKPCLEFRTKKVSGRFSPVRLELRKVAADGMKQELVQAIHKYINDFKIQASQAMPTIALPKGA